MNHTTTQAPSLAKRLYRTGSLCLNDLRHIFRDKVLLVVAIAPLLMIAMLRYALPVAESAFPLIAPHRILIVALFCMAAAILPAYLVSFIFLDEKDEQTLSAIRVLPIHPAAFLLYRLGLVLLGFLACWLMIRMAAGDLLPVGPDLALSGLAALGAPLVCLFVVSFAKNKIEGMTLLKGLNFVSVLPMLSFFAAPAWQSAAATVPFYWVFCAFQDVATDGISSPALAIGVIYHLAMIFLLYRLFRRRVF